MLLLAVLFLWAAITNVATAQQSPVVQTTTGPVRGRLISIAPDIQVYEFLGIPFAEPPTGQRRFAKPVPKQPWRSVLDAYHHPAGCPQSGILPALEASGVDKSMIWNTNASEDCLYLNIWVPKKTLDSKALATAPYTFIHGGGFIQGAVSIQAHDLGVMAGYNDIVTASVQYRLGLLGFAYDSNGQNAPGNMGMWDQIEAMKWLCENFAAFGADCEKHTIGGESAGSMSVSMHLLSSQSRPYFRRGIMQSGTTMLPDLPIAAERANQNSEAVVAVANNGNCAAASDPWQCLRELPVEKMIEAQNILAFTQGINFGPSLDGEFLSRNPGDMLDSGDVAKYPAIVGFTGLEGSALSLFTPYLLNLLAESGGDGVVLKRNFNFTHYEELLKAAFQTFAPQASNPLLIDSVKFHYWPLASGDGVLSGSSLYNAANQALGDYVIVCPAHAWLKSIAAIEGMGDKMWAYHYTHMPAHPTFPKWMGATHASEIPLVHGQPFADYASEYRYSRSDKLFSRLLMTYWANFVKNGDPNIGETLVSGTRLRTWPTFAGDTCKARYIDLSSFTQNYCYGPRYLCGVKDRDCTYWNDYIPKLSAALPGKE